MRRRLILAIAAARDQEVNMLARLSIPTLVLWMMFAGLIISMMLIGTKLGGRGVDIAAIGAATARDQARARSTNERPLKGAIDLRLATRRRRALVKHGRENPGRVRLLGPARRRRLRR
jgi:hypothetical protein